jgi:ribosomal protein L11 methyltransferase
MDYYKISLPASGEQAEILTALLGEFPFDTFDGDEQTLNAYILAKDWTEDIKTGVAETLSAFELSFTEEHIPAVNWNSAWEAAFEPVKVDNFCGVRATFHPAYTDVAHELLIDPKMSFGTGHHSTTWMMISLMRDIDFTGKRVLDYGCGTGILAILAEKLGASEVVALDYDPWCEENTRENLVLNNCTQTVVKLGELQAAGEAPFDIILANINRNVIQSNATALYQLTNPAGTMLCSGFLQSDVAPIATQLGQLGFTQNAQEGKLDWACVRFQKA